MVYARKAVTVLQFGIATAGSHVNVAALHVEFRERIRRFIQSAGDSRSVGELHVGSAARTYAHQKRLYDAYLARGRTHPVVANPNYVNPNTGRAGSAHQVQRAGRYSHGNLSNKFEAAYAVDLRWPGTGNRPGTIQVASLRSLAWAHHLDASVPSEWWHFSPTRTGPKTMVAGIGHSGEKVASVQTRLNAVSDAGLMVDGRYGMLTVEAVEAWQMASDREWTGDWSMDDEKALTEQFGASQPVEDRIRTTLRRTKRNADKALDAYLREDFDDSLEALRRVIVNAQRAVEQLAGG